MTCVSFAGNSEIFLSRKLYKEAMQQSKPKIVGGDFKLKDAKSGKNLASEFADTCTMVLFQNEEDQYLSHLAPELQHPDLASKILVKLDEFKQKAKEPLTVFVYGGQSYKLKNDPKSFNLFDNIVRVFEDADVDLSIIWGKKNSSFTDNMFASAKSSNIILSKEKKLGYQEPPKILSLKDLEDNYEIVEISPKHKIIFE